MLTERKKQVLAAIVQDYIASAEPVGSRTIARKYRLGVSPATIRNEMADLEEMGYIEQPHTSAGRIPSQKGYRYYVDYLMHRHRLTPAERRYILEGYENKCKQIGEIIQETGRLLAEMIPYAAVVTGPAEVSSVFKQVQLVPLEGGKALLVVVTSTGTVHHKLIEVPDRLTDEDLAVISRVLTAKLRGVPVEKIRLTLVKEIYHELAGHHHIFDTAVEMLQEALTLEHEEKVYLRGTLNILNQPEFRDISKVKTLLGLLEQEDVLRNLLQVRTDNPHEVTVRIGRENNMPEFEDCSVVTAVYSVDNQIMGSVGVIGPTRMEYDKVVSILEFVAHSLSKVLSRYYR